MGDSDSPAPGDVLGHPGGLAIDQIADCSEVVIVPRWASFGGWDVRMGGGEVGTIRGCRGTRAAGRLAGSDLLRCRAA